MGIIFLGLFSDSFFSQKTETLPRRVSVFSYMFVMIWFFFLSFSTYITSTIFKSLCTKYWCLSYLFYNIVACPVCYYRALPIFFLIHLKRSLNNENLILPNKICKNFLISNASSILVLDHQKQRVILDIISSIHRPWDKGKLFFARII